MERSSTPEAKEISTWWKVFKKLRYPFYKAEYFHTLHIDPRIIRLYHKDIDIGKNSVSH